MLGPLLPLWSLLFADDFDLTAEGRTFAQAILTFIWWVTLFGFPLSWRKSRGGLVYTWVGLEKSLREWSLGISASRAAWVDKWLSSTLEAKRIDTRELREALGRRVFVYSALHYDRPFLAPLLAFVALRRPGVTWRLPVYALVVIRRLRERLRTRRTLPMREWARLKNAVADGLSVAGGGWAPHYDPDGRIVLSRSQWFSVRLTEATARGRLSRVHRH